MALLDYENAKMVFKNDSDMLETVRRLEQFDMFHLLRNGNKPIGDKVNGLFSHVPSQMVEWYNVCNGGLLFDTTLLSVDAYDNELEVRFATFEENNNDENYKSLQLPEGYYVIGLRSYGDPICISNKDDKVYLWNVEEGDFEVTWESFNDFLGDETDSGIEMIADESLEPVPYKVEKGD